MSDYKNMNDEQLLRYSRQILLPEIDITGQEKLLASKVLIIGLGGLGCPVTLYLAAAGVGELILCDDDKVDLTNLQRQIAHATADIGKQKTVSVRESIAALNPDVKVRCINQKLAADDLQTEIAGVDVVVDCSDNFSTRFLVNKVCVTNKVPLVSGAAIRWEGQISVFDLRKPSAPCYQCLYPESADENLSCSQNGVLAPLVGVIGSLQAIEVLKLLVETGDSLVGRLLLFDAKAMEWRSLKLNKNILCPVCK